MCRPFAELPVALRVQVTDSLRVLIVALCCCRRLRTNPCSLLCVAVDMYYVSPLIVGLLLLVLRGVLHFQGAALLIKPQNWSHMHVCKSKHMLYYLQPIFCCAPCWGIR